MKRHPIAVIGGDGIGPEVIAEGIRILEAVSKKHNFKLDFTDFPWGGGHYLSTGEILPPNAIQELKQYPAIYLGAMGDPRVPRGLLEREILLKLRRALDLYVNLRPMKLYDERCCPLKKVSSLDILVVRENTEDLYAGLQGTIKKNTPDEMRMGIAFYSRKGVERILRYAFEAAKNRRKKVTLCDKSNAIPSQEIWDEIFVEIGKEYPEITREQIYVDACAMAFISRPQDLDVVVTTNLFGDILTDLGAELCGGIGLAPSGNINPGNCSMFEPIHGSAPPLAGKNKANPIGAILAGAMMLEHLGEREAAAEIDLAVGKLLKSGKIASPGANANLGAREISDLILSTC